VGGHSLTRSYYSESKLGKGAMDGNVTQHHDFMPKFDEWSEHCRLILAGKAKYYPTKFVHLLRESTDLLVVHLVDEIPTIEVIQPFEFEALLIHESNDSLPSCENTLLSPNYSTSKTGLRKRFKSAFRFGLCLCYS
jgi:hypothetical protein